MTRLYRIFTSGEYLKLSASAINNKNEEDKISEIRNILEKEKKEPGDIIFLTKMLWREEKGGISNEEKELRKAIWEAILVYSSGGKAIKDKDRSELSGDEKEIRSLGVVVIKGVLPKSGVLYFAGRVWGTFRNYGGSDYLLEIKDGWPERLFFLKDNSAEEFLKIVDNQTDEIIGPHIIELPGDMGYLSTQAHFYPKIISDMKINDLLLIGLADLPLDRTDIDFIGLEFIPQQLRGLEEWSVYRKIRDTLSLEIRKIWAKDHGVGDPGERHKEVWMTKPAISPVLGHKEGNSPIYGERAPSHLFSGRLGGSFLPAATKQFLSLILTIGLAEKGDGSIFSGSPLGENNSQPVFTQASSALKRIGHIWELYKLGDSKRFRAALREVGIEPETLIPKLKGKTSDYLRQKISNCIFREYPQSSQRRVFYNDTLDFVIGFEYSHYDLSPTFNLPEYFQIAYEIGGSLVGRIFYIENIELRYIDSFRKEMQMVVPYLLVQERLIELGKAIGQVDVCQAQNLHAQLVEVNKQMWARGFMNWDMKLAVNYGITKDNRVVLLDTGGIIKEKREPIISWYLPYFQGIEKVDYSKVFSIEAISSVWEANLEDIARSTFINDELEPVLKGIIQDELNIALTKHLKISSSSIDAKPLNLINGLIALDRLIRKKNEEISSDKKIYMRVTGEPCTGKSALGEFISLYGMGDIIPERIINLDTDKLYNEYGVVIGFPAENSVLWNVSAKEQGKNIKQFIPGLIKRLTMGKRLILLVGIRSAVFNPDGYWGSAKDRISMDIEVMLEARYEVLQERAMLRDGDIRKLYSSLMRSLVLYWGTKDNGRDIIINTEDIDNNSWIKQAVDGYKGDIAHKGLLENFMKFCFSPDKNRNSTLLFSKKDGNISSPLDEKGSPENSGCCVRTGMSSSAMAYSQFLMGIGRLSPERRLRAVSSIYGLNNEIRFLSFLGSTQANARAPP